MISALGTCDPAFEPVQRAFLRNFEEYPEVGAAVAVSLEGRLVVDLYSGYSDAAQTRSWESDTIVGCASTTKGLVGLCANMLVDRGLLDADRPVASYWPEFAQAGKEDIPVRFLLDHRAGLPLILKQLPPEALLDWKMITDELAAQKPLWDPGTLHSYHAMTYGYLVGEVIRRVSGKTVGTFLREEVTQPLKVDFYIGTPSAVDERCAETILGPDLSILSAMLPADPVAFRRAEVPSGNGHGNARALATIYGVLACGGERNGTSLLSRAVLENATSYEVTGPWFGRPDGGFADTRFACGFVLNSSVSYMGPNPKAFGYSGFGGSIGFADMQAGVGFGYTPNAHLTLPAPRESRSGRLVEALYACI